MGLKIYETEWLMYVEEDDGNCTYWVIRRAGVSPLFTKHKVKKRHITTAVNLFQNHPDGIAAVKPKEFRKLSYKEGLWWSPRVALEHKAETVTT